MVGMTMKRSNYPGFRFVHREGGIEEYELRANGLQVLLLEDDSTPTATSMVVFRVGSKHEKTGYTGATHILEHMLFKETKNYNKKKGTAIDFLFEKTGASPNATTSMDRTNYYETLPSIHLPQSIEIDADRMRGAILRERDLQTEMTVVRNEYEQGENDPIDVLYKGLWATSYTVHPYRHPTIGWREDIEAITVERLKHFYDTYYWPNNATLIVVGNFDKGPLLALVRSHFGRHARSLHAIPTVLEIEPRQDGMRRFEVRRESGTDTIVMGFRAPKALAREAMPLSIGMQILAGGENSRLYHALVERGLARSVFWFDAMGADPGLVMIFAIPMPLVSHARIESIIKRECKRLAQEGVSAAELARVKKGQVAAYYLGRDGSYATASALGEMAALSNWQYFVKYPNLIESVKGAAVREAARAYLDENSLTIGYYYAQKTVNKTMGNKQTKGRAKSRSRKMKMA